MLQHSGPNKYTRFYEQVALSWTSATIGQASEAGFRKCQPLSTEAIRTRREVLMTASSFPTRFPSKTWAEANLKLKALDLAAAVTRPFPIGRRVEHVGAYTLSELFDHVTERERRRLFSRFRIEQNLGLFASFKSWLAMPVRGPQRVSLELKRYILCVCPLNKRRDLGHVVAAWTLARRRSKNVPPLVIAASKIDFDILQSMARSVSDRDAVRVLEQRTDPELQQHGGARVGAQRAMR